MAEPHRESERKGVASFKAGAVAVCSAEEIEQLVVTFNVAMGEIVKVEKVDKAGKRQELTEEECAKLAGQDEVEEIEAALEEAFEAGVAVVLGDDEETRTRTTRTEAKTMRREPFGDFSSAGSSDASLSRGLRRRSCVGCSCAGSSGAGSSNVGFATKEKAKRQMHR